VSAADLAEQATLGALMLRPEPEAGVWSWLRASDFAKPWHRDVYKVLRELHDAGRGTSVGEVAPALADRLGVRRAGLPRLHDLVQAVPPDPDAGEYARFVLDGGVRRELAQQAIVLRAGARAAAVQQSPQPLLAALRSVAAVVDGAQHRVQLARTEPVPRGDAPAGEHLTPAVLEPLGADRFVSAYVTPPTGEVVEHERHLVGALIARPDCIPDVANVMDPTLVTNKRWAATYALVVDMHRGGRRIDLVTVAWQSESALTPDVRPSIRDLAAAVDDGAYADVAHTRHLVAANGLVYLADRHAASLTERLASPRSDVLAIIDEYRTTLGSLQAASAALGRRTWCGEVGHGVAIDPALTGTGLARSLNGPAA
jgi:replicative DNA helicase